MVHGAHQIKTMCNQLMQSRDHPKPSPQRVYKWGLLNYVRDTDPQSPHTRRVCRPRPGGGAGHAAQDGRGGQARSPVGVCGGPLVIAALHVGRHALLKSGGGLAVAGPEPRSNAAGVGCVDAGRHRVSLAAGPPSPLCSGSGFEGRSPRRARDGCCNECSVASLAIVGIRGICDSVSRLWAGSS